MGTKQGMLERALQLAQNISQADGEAVESRRHHDNLSRQRRLDLGKYLIGLGSDAEEIVKEIIASGTLTATEVSDIMAVTAWNKDTWEYLYNDVAMSFTVNRTLAGVRVKRRRGMGVPSYEQTMTALYDSAARNGGFVTEDEGLRAALAVLPAPNSLEHIIENAKEDDEYRMKIRAKGVYVLPPPPVDPPTPLGRELDPWVKRLVNLKADVAGLRDAAFADQYAPIKLVEECRVLSEILLGVADLVAGRKAMEMHEDGVLP